MNKEEGDLLRKKKVTCCCSLCFFSLLFLKVLTEFGFVFLPFLLWYGDVFWMGLHLSIGVRGEAFFFVVLD